MAALSRKSYIGYAYHIDDPAERDRASAAEALMACELGASVVRTHNVAATVQALKDLRPFVLLGLGCNVALVAGEGEEQEAKKAQLNHAIGQLCALPDSQIVDISSFYESEPAYYEGQEPFVNAVVLMRCGVPPEELLGYLHAIENSLGRVREIENGPRTCDVDILDYQMYVCASEELTLPHPRVCERDFVVKPLLELLPGHVLADGTPVDSVPEPQRVGQGRQAVGRAQFPVPGGLLSWQRREAMPMCGASPATRPVVRLAGKTSGQRRAVCPRTAFPTLTGHRFACANWREVSSTNDVVKRALEAGEPEGLAVRACRQTGGYGRQGRTWTSPEGGLYLSLLLRPRVPSAQLPTLSLVAGLAVREAVASFLDTKDAGSILVKWPNDVVVRQSCREGLCGHKTADSRHFQGMYSGAHAVACGWRASDQALSSGGSEDSRHESASGSVIGDSVPDSRSERASFAKLCGISLEAHAGGVCVGIGINVVPARRVCRRGRQEPPRLSGRRGGLGARRRA